MGCRRDWLVLGLAAVRFAFLVGMVRDVHRGVRRDILGNPGVCADADVIADGDGAEDVRPGTDDDMVANVRVALIPFLECVVGILLFFEVEGTEGDVLVEPAPVTDSGGLADDDAGAVVDEEVVSDLGARMDVDACVAFRGFGEFTGVLLPALLVQFMSDTLSNDGVESWIRSDNLKVGLRSRVAFICGFDVAFEALSDIGKIVDDGTNAVLGVSVGSIQLAASHELLAELGEDLLNVIGVSVACVGVPAAWEEEAVKEGEFSARVRGLRGGPWLVDRKGRLVGLVGGD